MKIGGELDSTGQRIAVCGVPQVVRLAALSSRSKKPNDEFNSVEDLEALWAKSPAVAEMSAVLV